VANFPRAKLRGQNTTIHHALTINSPAKNHTLHPAFRKTPGKNTTPPHQKNNPKKSTTNPITISQ